MYLRIVITKILIAIYICPALKNKNVILHNIRNLINYDLIIYLRITLTVHFLGIFLFRNHAFRK